MIESVGIAFVVASLGSLVVVALSRLVQRHEPVPNKQQKLSWFEDFAADVPDAYASIGSNINCEVMEAIVAGYVDRIFEETKDIVCRSTQLKSTTCGCSPNWIPIALTWSYRSSGLLSFLVRATKTSSTSSCFRNSKPFFSFFSPLFFFSRAPC